MPFPIHKIKARSRTELLANLSLPEQQVCGSCKKDLPHTEFKLKSGPKLKPELVKNCRGCIKLLKQKTKFDKKHTKYVKSINVAQLQDHVRSLPMKKALAFYEKHTQHGKDLQAIRQLVLVDLYYLLAVVCEVPGMKREWLYARCRDVESKPNGRLFLWAREHYKSTIITFGLTLQNILQNPELTVCIISAKLENSTALLNPIRVALEKNSILKQAFKDIIWDEPARQSDYWNKTEILLKRRGNPKESTITCSSLDSVRVGGHYDLLIYDDVVTQKEVTSPEMVREITNNFRLSLSLSKEGGVKRYIGTRYAHKDTYFYIMDAGIAEVDLHPATMDGTSSGAPVLFSDDYWGQKVRENTTFDLSCQYLLSPAVGKQKAFDISLIQRWEVRPSSLSIYILGDPGVKTNKEACDTAFVVIGVTGSKHLLLLDGFCHKMSLSERWIALKTLHQRWLGQVGIGAIKVGYEVFGHGASDVEYFRSEMSRGPSPFVFGIRELANPVKGQGNTTKQRRIERLDPDLRQLRIWVPYDNLTQGEHAGNPTALQLQAINSGSQGLVARSIKALDSEKRIYDLSKIFLEQLDEFPYGGKVDLIDAFSRIYDMDIKAPTNLVSKYGRTYIKPKGAGNIKPGLNPNYIGPPNRGGFMKTGRTWASNRYSHK